MLLTYYLEMNKPTSNNTKIINIYLTFSLKWAKVKT